MPTIQRLSRASITMYADDHAPPHFHVVAKDGKQALVAISALTVLAGTVERKTLDETLMWAENNLEFLIEKWDELNHVE
jgi:hypothetical protein